MIINFNNNEYQYLINSDYLDKEIINSLSRFNNLSKVCEIELQDEYVDRLREQLEDRLQVAGFDNNYELTEEGGIIEGLIDKLDA